MSLKCSHDSFSLDFGAEFFGVSDGDVSAFDPIFNTQYNNGRFQINCPLGECGMTAEINSDGSILKYVMQVATEEANAISVAGRGRHSLIGKTGPIRFFEKAKDPIYFVDRATFFGN
jgi:hypothetical protein